MPRSRGLGPARRLFDRGSLTPRSSLRFTLVPACAVVHDWTDRSLIPNFAAALADRA